MLDQTHCKISHLRFLFILLQRRPEARLRPGPGARREEGVGRKFASLKREYHYVKLMMFLFVSKCSAQITLVFMTTIS